MEVRWKPESLKKYRSKNAAPLDSLLFLASRGHYPLFFSQWLNETSSTADCLSLKEAKLAVEKIWLRLSPHRTLAKQKTMLLSLKEDERQLFIRAFLRLVESSLIDQGVLLH